MASLFVNYRHTLHNNTSYYYYYFDVHYAMNVTFTTSTLTIETLTLGFDNQTEDGQNFIDVNIRL